MFEVFMAVRTPGDFHPQVAWGECEVLRDTFWDTWYLQPKTLVSRNGIFRPPNSLQLDEPSFPTRMKKKILGSSISKFVDWLLIIHLVPRGCNRLLFSF